MQKPEPLISANTIFSVSDASALLKGVVETAFSCIRIRGELSGITRAASGHIYFTIKDSGAAISGIIWRGTPMNFNMADGLEVIATGKLTTYPARSNYQMIVSEIEIAGAGAILKMLEDRKQKLAAEGLFDASRKKPLPRFPQTIGIVSSPTGAAFQDIQNKLRDRLPAHIILYPAQVQGATAAAEIAAGINYFNARKNVDVIIVARGGGSLEDLLPFSEEIVVRAAAASEIPLISGVGHEPDWMLIDFAADVRAPTPTGAAEIVVPTKISLFSEIENLWHRVHSNFANRLINARQRIDTTVIKNPTQLIFEHQQRLDDAAKTLGIIINGRLASGKQQVAAVQNFRMILQNKFTALNAGVSHMDQMLNSLSYKNVLRRGYAIVRKEKNIISSTADFSRPAQIEFADGTVEV
ncbi:MAG: exodeoxyribonuclease VII large subunit [Rickettsiales bacterium]|jgi:exodeoxyribonuclease VII large subunit|nr:exodeoxyribonuclease VII large subunit [Rickettsiales bacterium]